MRIRPWLALLVLLIPVTAHADGHTASAFFGYSYLHNGINGFNFNVDFTLESVHKAGSPNWTVVGDYSRHSGSPDGRDVTQQTFLGGLRYTFAGGGHPKVVPFAQLLGGGLHISEDNTGDADPALIAGIGFDFLPLRDDKSQAEWGIRVQADYIVRGGVVSPRISVGGVKRFKRGP